LKRTLTGRSKKRAAAVEPRQEKYLNWVENILPKEEHCIASEYQDIGREKHIAESKGPMKSEIATLRWVARTTTTYHRRNKNGSPAKRSGGIGNETKKRKK